MIHNVGLTVLNLMDGESVSCENPKQRPKHSSEYDGLYTEPLEQLVHKCVDVNPKNRPTLHHVLYATRLGLARWEKVYGQVRGKTLDELPDFAKVVLADEEFRIGDAAPTSWAPKKRKAEENAEADEEAPERSSQRSKTSHHPEAFEEAYDAPEEADAFEEAGNTSGEANDAPEEADDAPQYKPPSYKRKGKTPVAPPGVFIDERGHRQTPSRSLKAAHHRSASMTTQERELLEEDPDRTLIHYSPTHDPYAS